jgi:hypothetical protein
VFIKQSVNKTFTMSSKSSEKSKPSSIKLNCPSRVYEITQVDTREALLCTKKDTIEVSQLKFKRSAIQFLKMPMPKLFCKRKNRVSFIFTSVIQNYKIVKEI